MAKEIDEVQWKTLDYTFCDTYVNIYEWENSYISITANANKSLSELQNYICEIIVWNYQK